MPVSAGRLLVTAAGGILLWSGIKGKSVTGVFRAVIGGQSPATAVSANPINLDSYAYGYGSGSSSGSTGGTAAAGNTGASSPSAASNQALARMLAIGMGHADWTTGQQWADWVSLWNQESGWSITAHNASGASGIAQNIHGYGPDYQQGNAQSQITWGINYIDGRYGSPSAAWAHEVANNWY